MNKAETIADDDGWSYRSTQIIKRQHTVPEMFLKAFASGKKGNTLVQYLRSTGDCSEVNVSDAAVQKHAYTLREHSTLDPMYLEHRFNILETAAGVPLRKIRSGEPLATEDRFRLSELFAAQERRTTARSEHRETQADAFKNSPEDTIAFIERDRARFESRCGRDEVDRLIEKIQTTGQGLEPSRNEWMLNAYLGLQKATELTGRPTSVIL